MKKVLAGILLLSHINFSMFIAQVDEVDIYDANGRQVNDINSLSEYINDVILDHPDKSRQDEDDDNARYFQVSATSLYDFHQYNLKVSSGDFRTDNEREYSLFKENKWFSPVLEINIPPPKA